MRIHDWTVLSNQDLGSDHLPIHLSCGTSIQNNFIPPKQLHFRTDSANWDSFYTETGTFDWSSCRHEDTNIYASKIIDSIIQIAKKHIPHSDPDSNKPIPRKAKRSVPWWDEDCEEAKRNKNEARNIWQNTKTQESLNNYKTKRNLATKINNKKQSEYFKKKCTDLNETTREGEVWKLISSMEGRKKVGPNTAILIDQDGNEVVNNKDKANLLGQHYENISADTNLDPNFLRKKHDHKRNNPHLLRKQPNNLDPINIDFTIEELLGTVLKKTLNQLRERMGYPMKF